MNKEIFLQLFNNIHLRNHVFNFIKEFKKDEKVWVTGKDIIENQSLLQMIRYGCDQFFYQLFKRNIKEGSKEECIIARAMFRESILYGRDNISSYLIERVGSRMLPPISKDINEHEIVERLKYQQFINIKELYENHLKISIPPLFLQHCLWRSIQLGDIKLFKIIFNIIPKEWSDNERISMIRDFDKVFMDHQDSLELVKQLYCSNLFSSYGVEPVIKRFIHTNNINHLQQLLEFLKEKGEDLNSFITTDSMDDAAVHNDLEIFKYLHDQFKDLVPSQWAYSPHCISGSLSTIQYLLDEFNVVGFPAAETYLSMALQSGHDELVFYILGRATDLVNVDTYGINKKLMTMDFISRLYSKGVSISGDLLFQAVELEDIELIEYIETRIGQEQQEPNPFTNPENLMNIALNRGGIKAIEYFIKKYPTTQFQLSIFGAYSDYPNNISDVFDFVINNHNSFRTIQYSNITHLLMLEKYDTIKKIFETIGAVPDERIEQNQQPLVDTAYVKNAPKDIIELMIEADRKVGQYQVVNVTVQAASRGDLEFMIRMIDIFKPFESHIECINRAIDQKNMEVLEYLLSSYYPDGKGLQDFLARSIETNNVKVLSYLLTKSKQEFDYTQSIKVAILDGHVEVITFLVEHPSIKLNYKLVDFVAREIILMDKYMKCYQIIYRHFKVNDERTLEMIQSFSIYNFTSLIRYAFDNYQNQFLIILIQIFHLKLHRQVNSIAQSIYQTIDIFSYEFGSIKIINYLNKISF